MSLLRSGRNGHRLRRFRARRGCGWVVLKWRAHESLADWRVLRSQVGFAGTAHEAAKPGLLSYSSTKAPTSEVQDRDVIGGHATTTTPSSGESRAASGSAKRM